MMAAARIHDTDASLLLTFIPILLMVVTFYVLLFLRITSFPGPFWD